MKIENLAEEVRNWMQEAGQRIREQLTRPMQVKTKSGPKDLVTNIDKSTEAFFREKIQKTYPNDKILGEEGGNDQIKDLTGSVWIIDPIDGTTNFVCQKKNFAIMIGYFVDESPAFGAIYDVMQDDYFERICGKELRRNGQVYSLPCQDKALKDSLMAASSRLVLGNSHNFLEIVDHSLGFRCYGSASMEILALLKGDIALYAAMNLKPWDLAAGMALLKGTPIRITRLDGGEINLMTETPALMAYPSAYATFLENYKD